MTELSRIQSALADRYVIERELGRGGMAVVYLAEDRAAPRKVAVKILSPGLADRITRERFLREIAFSAKLTHPNIVPILDSGEADRLLYYVMPYLDGESLRERLRRETQLPIDDALRIIREAAAGLVWAHGYGIIHRDVKPENILLWKGRTLVTDFGIAVAFTAALDERLTRPGETLGTPLYMSPEQAMGRRHLDHRTDLYSLACVLYELLAGEPPFRPRRNAAVIVRGINDPLPRVGQVRGDVPREVDKALARALAWRPLQRFDSIIEFIDALPAPA